jgi:hypothetical protein
VNALWSYFWPVFAAGLLIGGIGGLFAFPRKPRRAMALMIGLALTIAAVGLWHGPLGGADHFASRVERDARATLVHWEVPQMRAHLHRSPLTRRLLLAGPADDFQRTELVRTMETLPGVREASWSNDGGGLPLIVEGLGSAFLGFLVGVLLAYLVELRRRYNSQWNW